MTDAISTRARQMAAELRGDQLVPGQRVATTLERLDDTHDQLLALVREMQQQAAKTLQGDPK